MPESASRRHRSDHHGHTDRSERRERRTQAERSAETRIKLLDATTDCLSALGYTRTTTTEICRRAGVSRGAMLHHFPSKAVLVAAACEHIFERRVSEFRAAITQVPEGGDRLSAAIDITWAMYENDSFAAWCELVTAARTDADLRPHVALVAARAAELTRAQWDELFVPPVSDDPIIAELYPAVPAFLFAVLDGLAMTRMTGMPGAEAEAQRVLALLKLAALELPTASPQEDP